MGLSDCLNRRDSLHAKYLQTSDNFIVELNTLNIDAIPKNIKHNANAKLSKYKIKLKSSCRLNSWCTFLTKENKQNSK